MFKSIIMQVASLILLLTAASYSARAAEGDHEKCMREVETRLTAVGCPDNASVETQKECCSLNNNETGRDACITAQIAGCVAKADEKANYENLHGLEYFLFRGMQFSTQVGRSKNDLSTTTATSSTPKLSSKEEQTWSIDFGYFDKAILRDLVAVVEEYHELGWGDGTLVGDLFIDPFKLTATVGYGDVFRPNAEQPTTPPSFEDEFEEADKWNVSIKYQLPIEYLYGHLIRSRSLKDVRDSDGWKIPKE